MRILVITSSTLGSVVGLFSGQHEVVVCHSRTEAMDLLKNSSFDVVVGAPSEWRIESTAGSSDNVLAFPSTRSAAAVISAGRGLNVELDEIESKLVEEAMAKTNHNQVQAARLLKITRGALQYKLKKYAKNPNTLEEAA